MTQRTTLDPRTALGLIVAIVAVAAVIGISLSGDDGGAPLATPTTTPTNDLDDALDLDLGADADSSDTTEGPEVPPVACETLLTSEEVDDALGTWDRDPVPSSLQFSRSEACVDQYVDQPAYFVSIGPGEATDFLPTALLDGASGEAVDGPGDGAAWFGGDDVGTLAVWEETELGVVVYRVAVGRPDVDDGARHDIAQELAAAALPRFPGVFVEPTLVDLGLEAADTAALGYVENVRAGVDAGRWTEGEGLVATLEVLTGRRSADEVLSDENLVNADASGLVRLAAQYGADGADREAAESIAALLAELRPDPAELDALKLAAASAPDGTESGDTEEQQAIGLAAPGRFFRPVRVFIPLAQESEVCAGGSCSTVIEVAPGVWLIAPVDGPWSQDQINFAIAAAQQAAQALDAFGDLPADLTIFLSTKDGPSWVDTSLGSESHVALINLDLAALTPEQFQQAVAEQMAHSMLAATYDFTSMDGADGWWVDGMALFLSGLIFADTNLEHATLDWLGPNEFLLPLTDRGANTWPFFQYMWNALGEDGFGEFLGSMNDLQSFDNIDFHWQRFNELLTSGEILDANGQPIPFDVITLPLEVIGPLTLNQTLDPFKVLRLSISAIGQDACISFSGAGVTASYRYSGVGEAGSVWDNVPKGQPPGTAATLILTATKPGASFSLKLKQKAPGEDCSFFEDHGPTRTDPCDLDLICRASRYFKDAPSFREVVDEYLE